MEGNTLEQLVFEDYFNDSSADNLALMISCSCNLRVCERQIMNVVRFLSRSLPVNNVPLVSLSTESLEEVREDLRTIGWDDFTVKSVVTVETAAPAGSMLCCFTVPVSEKNGKKKEIEKESVPVYHTPSIES